MKDTSNAQITLQVLFPVSRDNRKNRGKMLYLLRVSLQKRIRIGENNGHDLKQERYKSVL